MIYGAVDIAQHDIRPTLPLLLDHLRSMANFVEEGTGGDSCPVWDGRNAHDIAGDMVVQVERLMECETRLVESLNAYVAQV